MSVPVHESPIAIAKDLDAALAESEARCRPIAGTEKTIVWTGTPGQQTDLAVIYIHGFSATRREIAPTADIVSRELKANLFYTRLTGHGIDGAALARATLQDWLDDVWEAWRIGSRIGRRVVAVGMSTGAPLVTWLACQSGVDLPAMVLLSPNFGVRMPGARFVLSSRLLTRLLIGRTRQWQPRTPEHATYWTPRYPSSALVAMNRAVRMVRRLPLESCTVPVLVFYTEADEIISTRAMRSVFARLNGTPGNLVAVPATQHVLAGDILSPGTTGVVATRSIDFIRRVTGVELSA